MARGRRDYGVWIVLGVVTALVAGVVVLAVATRRPPAGPVAPDPGPQAAERPDPPAAPVAPPRGPIDDPAYFARPVVISNVQARVAFIQLMPVDPKWSEERKGEPSWSVSVEFKPVNGRQKFEFWNSYVRESGNPFILVGRTKHVIIGERFRAADTEFKKDVATPAKPKTFLVIFEATPDPIDELRIYIPTQLPGHEQEHFELVVPGDRIQRKDWDNRPQ